MLLSRGLVIRFESVGDASEAWNDMSRRWHGDYACGRPTYPAEVVRVPGLPSSAAVLELGAGTGKLTRLLVAVEAVALAGPLTLSSPPKPFHCVCPRAGAR
jgi:hypothetical protein